MVLSSLASLCCGVSVTNLSHRLVAMFPLKPNLPLIFAFSFSPGSLFASLTVVPLFLNFCFSVHIRSRSISILQCLPQLEPSDDRYVLSPPHLKTTLLGSSFFSPYALTTIASYTLAILYTLYSTHVATRNFC